MSCQLIFEVNQPTVTKVCCLNAAVKNCFVVKGSITEVVGSKNEFPLPAVGGSNVRTQRANTVEPLYKGHSQTDEWWPFMEVQLKSTADIFSDG